MFAPKWKKEAKLLDKAAKKFLNYKRDLLEEQQIAEIESRRADLRNAAREGNKDQTAEASKQLQATCENALPRYRPQGWVEENIEVFFVAIVIALGLRAYVVQPFRIPTGSMQPTLNGIIATRVDSTDDFPSFPVRTLQWGSHGRSYVDIELSEDKVLRQKNPVVEVQSIHVPGLNIELPSFNFVTNTHIYFQDGSKVVFPGPKAALMNNKGMGFGSICGYPTNDMSPEENLAYNVATGGLDPMTGQVRNPQQRQAAISELIAKGAAYDESGNGRIGGLFLNTKLPKGTVIARGYVDSGDLILVDKISYHFRNPKRGEVFVFDTRDIKKIHADARRNGGIAGSHYIKRLAGVPGDQLEIKVNDLYINGSRAQSPGFLQVMSERQGYHYGYGPIGKLEPGKTLSANFSKQPGMNEYIALGDNSYNSADSRDWGTVKEFNLIGPASVSLWPFFSGHWGFIK